MPVEMTGVRVVSHCHTQPEVARGLSSPSLEWCQSWPVESQNFHHHQAAKRSPLCSVWGGHVGSNKEAFESQKFRPHPAVMRIPLTHTYQCQWGQNDEHRHLCSLGRNKAMLLIPHSLLRE